MLKVVCDKCGVEKVVDGSEGMTTVAYSDDNGEHKLECHLCSDCLVAFSELNKLHRDKVDELAKKRDEVVVPEYEAFKSEVEELSKELSDWVRDYVSKDEVSTVDRG